MVMIPSIKCITEVLKSLKPGEVRQFFREPPTINARELKFAKYAPLKKDVYQAQYIYQGSIPLHELRGIHFNNPKIRELHEKGLDYLIEEYGKRVACETINIDNEIMSQFQRIKPTEKVITGYRGVVEYNPRSKKYLNMLYNTNVGDIIVLDHGYPHSALSRLVADDFATQVKTLRKAIIETDFQAGSQISISSEYGGEIVAQRGMKYLVKEKHINEDGSLYLKLENILPYNPNPPIRKTEELLAYEQRLLEHENLPPGRGKSIYDNFDSI